MATPRLDAELLIAHALGLSRVDLYVQFERPVETGELGALRELVRRRQNGEPVAYLVGHKEFWGIELAVDARVLIPRPDTEAAVEEALARLDEVAPRDAPDAAPHRAVAPLPLPLRIADVGTGSGALAIVLARARPDALVFACDVSEDAAAVARANVLHHEAAVTVVVGDLAAPLAPHGPFAVVVANLPYVPTGDLAALPPDVRSEPRAALDGGPDGLQVVRRLVAQAPALLLRPGGALILEVGHGQAAAVAAACTQVGLSDARVRRDLAGIERVVSARRTS